MEPITIHVLSNWVSMLCQDSLVLLKACIITFHLARIVYFFLCKNAFLINKLLFILGTIWLRLTATFCRRSRQFTDRQTNRQTNGRRIKKNDQNSSRVFSLGEVYSCTYYLTFNVLSPLIKFLFVHGPNLPRHLSSLYWLCWNVNILPEILTSLLDRQRKQRRHLV